MVSPLSRHQQNPFGWAFGRMRGEDGGCRHAEGTRTMQRLLAVQRTSEQGIELEIQTDEGDTVTISFHAETEATAISYRRKSHGPEGRESAKLKAAEITSSHELNVTVEGQLSEAEMADVEELLARVKVAVESFFAGGGEEEAIALAAQGGDSLESLSGFRLDLERSETMTAVALRLREWKPAAESLPASPVANPATRTEPVPAAPVASEAPGEPEAPASPVKPEAVAAPAAPDVSWILRLLEERAGTRTSLLA